MALGAFLTLMLLAANLSNTKLYKKNLKMTETLANGYSSESTRRELSNVYTNMTGFGWFSKILCPCALDESSLSIGRVKVMAPGVYMLKFL